MMRGSNRIIGIGSKRFQYNSLKRLGQAQNDLIFEGFLCIEEPMVPGVAKCISRCKASGIRVILLCREESENNQALAVSMGIAQNASECISIEKIKTMKEDLLRAQYLDLFHVRGSAQRSAAVYHEMAPGGLRI